MSPCQPTVSVVIPTLNEAQGIVETLHAVVKYLPGAQVIVSDGGSQDSTCMLAAQAGAHVVRSVRGRGNQCVAGAAQAAGDLLFFLHADTRPPPEIAQVFSAWFARPEVQIGTFRLAFDEGGRFLRACAWCSRFDSVLTRFGDQGIVVRRAFYDRLGGFPRWPLFEDVELLRRARRKTRVWSFPAAVITSSRRFRHRGAWRQQWQNTRLLLRFLAGVSPETLAAEYQNTRRRDPQPPSCPATEAKL